MSHKNQTRLVQVLALFVAFLVGWIASLTLGEQTHLVVSKLFSSFGSPASVCLTPTPCEFAHALEDARSIQILMGVLLVHRNLDIGYTMVYIG